MRSLFISLRSEFYKSRKGLAFWAAILLPVLICGLIAFGYFNSSERILRNNMPPMGLWGQYSSQALAVMGMLILPFYVIFMAFSVNNIEHKNDTWKTLFSLPLQKLSVYSAKFFYSVLLVLICLALFMGLTYLFAHLLHLLIPAYRFDLYDPSLLLFQYYLKLFLSAMGILSFQFVLSLMWGDFLKPMGLGFVGTIAGIICANVQWKWAYLIPFSHPTLAMRMGKLRKSPADGIDIMTQEIWTSLAYMVVFFILGYFILAKKNIK
ncbi:ABC transporter permease [Pedobacter yulinensis]|uniref:ABC transporter permease n=1 Tax=Pedobacter yulinensis TaxID=2126353 RepID=A0A2T3HQY3_9SPHI|nr:ABC transporter permease [Pedobacter yulinensis]PST84839.1 ABC transporter permease [Pedobacter yulinensis]